MKRILSIEIDCGDSTCADSVGSFCTYTGSRYFGCIAICFLFQKDLVSKDGWLQRCEECISYEKREEPV
jgi:hypothetical protein